MDAVTFFILALIVYGIEIPQETRKMEKSILSEFREDIQDFSKFLKGESSIFVILGIALVSNLIFGPFRVVAPKLSVLLAGGSGGSGIFGLLMAMLSLGVVLGMSALGKFQFPKGKSILGGMALLGIAMIPIGIFKDIFVAVALFTVVGLGMGLVNVSVRTLLQSLTPDKLRGKIMGLTLTFAMVGQPIGQTLGGYIVAAYGAQPYFLGAGIALLLVVIVSLSSSFLRTTD